MKRFVFVWAFVLFALTVMVNASNAASVKGKVGDPVRDNAVRMVEEGKKIFRFDTFGDEAFWGDALKIHQ